MFWQRKKDVAGSYEIKDTNCIKYVSKEVSSFVGNPVDSNFNSYLVNFVKARLMKIIIRNEKKN